MGQTKTLNTILMIGPLTNIHGQGYVTSLASRCFIDNGYYVEIIDTHSSKSAFKVLNNISVILKSFQKILFSRNCFKKVYFTPSRNKFSSLRDFFLLLTCKISNLVGKQRIYLVAHLHGSDLDSFLLSNGIYGKFLRYLYHSELSKMIILSETHMNFALGEDFCSYQVINNPLEFNEKDWAKSSKLFKNEFIKISFISNPDSSKGLYESIMWIKENIKINKWSFKIIGWSKDDFKKEYGYIKTKSLNEILSNKDIIFMGSLYGNEKVKVLEESNLFIFLSRYKSEAQPIAVMEAIYSRNAILLSNFKMLVDFNIYKSVMYSHETDEHDLLNMISNTNLLEESARLLEYNHSVERFNKTLIGCFNEDK
jgi:hypothetical protein